MKKRAIYLSIGVAAIAMVSVFSASHRTVDTPAVSSEVPSVVAETAAPLMDKKNEVVKESNVVASPQVVSEPAFFSESEKRELTTQLEDFDHLYKKLLKSAEEREEYHASLKNKKVFPLIKKMILHPTRENAKLQDLGLNYLMEALQTDRPGVSVVLSEIIADASIENSKIPIETRQQQAELKAEILYQWTSMYPEQATTVSGLLPGRASQNIWRNVQDLQANNESESVDAY